MHTLHTHKRTDSGDRQPEPSLPDDREYIDYRLYRMSYYIATSHVAWSARGIFIDYFRGHLQQSVGGFCVCPGGQ